jgi:serine/threonine protein kinase
LLPGRKLAHYEILAKLGEGGMGEVYRGRDLKLGREVALKVLPSELAGDVARRSRFEREAKAVAALNHPNIVTLYSIEEADEVRFLTMELVQGDTLERHGLVRLS